MNYQSGDRLKNRYLSNDAFTSLKNKLGGRSITSLGNDRRRNSYKVANQGFDLLDYKSFIYKSFISLLLLIISIYIIPQTRYIAHGFVSQKIENSNNITTVDNDIDVYDVASVFLKTDEFIAKQKTTYVNNGIYVYDLFTNNLIGVTTVNSSSTVNIKLFSDSGFKNNFLIEQSSIIKPDIDNPNNNIDIASSSVSSPSSTSTSAGEGIDIVPTQTVQENNNIYQSYVFEGLGYGQLIAKVPPKTEVKKDTFLYIRTVDGLKPIAKIINVDEDNKSTFTIIYAQLTVSPQNIYKVVFK